MEMTNELVSRLRILHKNMENDSLDEFTTKVKDSSEKFNLSYQEILNLLLDEEKLKIVVIKETDKINDQIEKLEKELEFLKEQKHNMGSLICEFHGHTFYDYKRGDYSMSQGYCMNCGETHNLKSNGYYDKKALKQKKIYYKGEKR